MATSNRFRSLASARTAPQTVVDALRDEIVRGAIAPGSALRQEALAARFAISRIPVKEALLQLEAEGLVEVRPNRGAVVIALSSAEIAEIYDLRMLLEVDALARAAAAMTPQDLGRIERAMKVAEIGADGDDWAALDDAFHAALYAPARRPRQTAMIGGLRAAVRRYAARYAALPAETATWLADHRAIVAALGAGQKDAAVARLRDHIEAAGRVVLAAEQKGG